jgi:hypothetical protein
VNRSHLQSVRPSACPSPHGVRVAWHAAFTAQPAQQGDGQPIDASLQPAALPPVLSFNAVIAISSPASSGSRNFTPAWQSHGIKQKTPQGIRPHHFPAYFNLTTKTRSHKRTSLNSLRLCVFALKPFPLQKPALHPLSGKIGTCEA